MGIAPRPIDEADASESPRLAVSEAEAARALSLSVRTLQRLRLEGGGPPFLRLTERRIAYSWASLTEWLSVRSCASTSVARPEHGGAA